MEQREQAVEAYFDALFLAARNGEQMDTLRKALDPRNNYPSDLDIVEVAKTLYKAHKEISKKLGLQEKAARKSAGQLQHNDRQIFQNSLRFIFLRNVGDIAWYRQ